MLVSSATEQLLARHKRRQGWASGVLGDRRSNAHLISSSRRYSQGASWQDPLCSLPKPARTPHCRLECRWRRARTMGRIVDQIKKYPNIITAHIYWSTIASPSANALYIHHALSLGASHDGYREIPCTNDYQTSVTFNVQTPGCWWATWVDPLSGMNLSQTISYYPAGSFALPLPPFYLEDVVAVVNYQGPGPNCLYWK